MAGSQQCWLALWVHAARVGTNECGDGKAWKFRSGRHARQQYGISNRRACPLYRQWLNSESYSSHFGISVALVGFVVAAVCGVSFTLCCKVSVGEISNESPIGDRNRVTTPNLRSSAPISGLRLVRYRFSRSLQVYIVLKYYGCGMSPIMCPRLIIADDHTLVAQAFAALLQPEFEVMGTFADGRSLLAAVLELKPDVIILDVGMPVMNGLEAGKRIRKLMRTVKIVYLTMNTNIGVAAEAFRGGVWLPFEEL